MNTETHVALSELARRLEELQGRAEYALSHHEGRTMAQIEEALLVVAKYIAQDEDSTQLENVDLEQALLDDGCMELWPALLGKWARDGIGLSHPRALGLIAAPFWDYAEIFAVVGLVYVRFARRLLDQGSAPAIALAAMAYADGLESFQSWHELRGLAHSRNPHPAVADIRTRLDEQAAAPFIEEFISKRNRENAGNTAKAREMSQVRPEWEKWERGDAAYRGKSFQEFLTEMVERHPTLLRKSIENAVGRWRKAKPTLQ